MASPYLSQITMFGGNFAPKNYALCNGQLLSINRTRRCSRCSGRRTAATA